MKAVSKVGRMITPHNPSVLPLLMILLACPALAAPKTTHAPRRDFCRVVCEQPSLSGSNRERFKPVRCTPCAELDMC
ncbi:hypothetical protein [Chitinibacter sp. GC72]|uniref:hypothetical protein n=1 Tax=Chitinibacter sp. GC72 TaxID=1526917 RepID=UPI0018DFB957|nr:hypothetical protein [Chitinibacter sp. GC72]